jgi:hypothetical protein
MKPEGKNAYVVDVAELGFFGASDKDLLNPKALRQMAPLRLFEDGKQLGPPHQMHDLIRNKGLGGFSHWGRSLYFSTSDNSDPRQNGREYTLETSLSVESGLRRAWWKARRKLRWALVGISAAMRRHSR